MCRRVYSIWNLSFLARGPKREQKGDWKNDPINLLMNSGSPPSYANLILHIKPKTLRIGHWMVHMWHRSAQHCRLKTEPTVQPQATEGSLVICGLNPTWSIAKWKISTFSRGFKQDPDSHNRMLTMSRIQSKIIQYAKNQKKKKNLESHKNSERNKDILRWRKLMEINENS